MKTILSALYTMLISIAYYAIVILYTNWAMTFGTLGLILSFVACIPIYFLSTLIDAALVLRPYYKMNLSKLHVSVLLFIYTAIFLMFTFQIWNYLWGREGHWILVGIVATILNWMFFIQRGNSIVTTYRKFVFHD